MFPFFFYRVFFSCWVEYILRKLCCRSVIHYFRTLLEVIQVSTSAVKNKMNEWKNERMVTYRIFQIVVQLFSHWNREDTVVVVLWRCWILHNISIVISKIKKLVHTVRAWLYTYEKKEKPSNYDLDCDNITHSHV